MENSINELPIRTSEWVITLLVASIPIINFIMFFVWAFGSGTHASKANWAKAMLIWLAVITVIYTLIAIVFGVAILSAFA